MITFRTMPKMKIVKVILFLAILNINEINGTVKVLSRSEQARPNWQLDAYRITAFDDGRLLSTLCDNGDDKKTCIIIIEELLSGKTIYTCNITLNPEQKNARPGKFFARSFGKDKAIFIWEEKGDETFVKFVTMKLPNCESNEVKLHDTSKMQLIEPIAYQLYTSLKIAVYDDYYDVFFKDDKRCTNRECKISIDANGNFIDGLISSFVSTSRYLMVEVLQPIVKRTPNRGFFCVKFSYNRTYFSLVQSDGKEKSLGTIDNDSQIAGVVVDHEKIGVCILVEREYKIKCTQYDGDGNIKLKTMISDISSRTNLVSILILREGGFLLMFYQSEPCQYSQECMTIKNCWIIKVDATGKIESHFRFQRFTLTNIVYRAGFIYENPDGEGYCATVVYSDYDLINGKKGANNRRVITNCFTEIDFTQ